MTSLFKKKNKGLLFSFQIYKLLPFLSGAQVLQVLNSDSQALAKDFGGPILDYAIDYAMNVTQKFFDAYTYDQISHVPLTDEFFEKEKK